MQVVQAVCGTFHHFDLARELNSRGSLAHIYSSFPWIRLSREGVPRERVRTFPWIHGPWMAAHRYGIMPRRIANETAILNARLFDAWVASRIEDCDALVAISGCGLLAGRTVQKRGGRYVCDRGSSHIRFQRRILDEEYAHWGFRGERVDLRVVDREEREYAQSDAITVPSEFARRTFIEAGVDGSNLKVIPYGVRLDKFQKTGEPRSDTFEVLFAGAVSLRKGMPYLLDAFSKFKHPTKRLRLVGPVEPQMRSLFSQFSMTNVEVLGRQTQEELAKWMNASHVMVLPSIEDGFGLVMAQSMACGTPVIASDNTGGSDLFNDGVQGFLVPIRSPEAICDRLTVLADNPDLLRRMSEAALARVQNLGGWRDYGNQYASFLQELTGRK